VTRLHKAHKQACNLHTSSSLCWAAGRDAACAATARLSRSICSLSRSFLRTAFASWLARGCRKAQAAQSETRTDRSLVTVVSVGDARSIPGNIGTKTLADRSARLAYRVPQPPIAASRPAPRAGLIAMVTTFDARCIRDIRLIDRPRSMHGGQRIALQALAWVQTDQQDHAPSIQASQSSSSSRYSSSV
jgi:hypothetical protein